MTDDIEMASCDNISNIEEDFIYRGDDLGAFYDNGRARFRLWAPKAKNVVLELYNNDTDDAYESHTMTVSEDGTWTYSGDMAEGTYYTYRVDGRVSQDPYSRATGCNGARSMLIDLALTDPEGFDSDKGPALASPVDAIICETSILDATGDISSHACHRGKYLGLAEKGLKTGAGLPTGLDHFKALGVTHVQLMPVYDFGSIDEAVSTIDNEDNYNWGYDPVNYMVPEGSFATDPHDGRVRIREFKEMIKAFHEEGLGVIMDVVFNHTYDLDSSFQRVYPDHFYRKDGDKYSDASACGNEVASERPMVRKYIIDCLRYWMEEYHIDGFRFDLMGCLDLDTMAEVNRVLRAIRPDVLLYGEGWLGGESVLPVNKRATKAMIRGIDGIGAFSDDIRDGIRGNVFENTECGFATGDLDSKADIRFSVVAACSHPETDPEREEEGKVKAWATSPCRVINYVSCHDNMTLWDRICMSRKDASLEDRLLMNRLAAFIVFTSQGIPFFLHGEEILRSKGFNENSFNMPLSLNSIKYDLTDDQAAMLDYYKELIRLRKRLPSLHMVAAEEVRDKISFLDSPDEPQLVAYRAGDLFVVYNASDSPAVIKAPVSGSYKVLAEGGVIKADGICTKSVTKGNEIEIAPISSYLAVIS
ncbi:type I pullulanase [Butyrivibrio sp. MC2013]|uniref:type I pullulanase n=1 Tax=Butyrivibrio sp. MC2013 TaxID=1280686 RepID=UPI0003FA1D5D|nr:type I pullulanase [Butyrivibrio sp. MC2013]